MNNIRSKMAKVIIYKTPWCAFCKTEQEWLDSINVEYITKDIEADPKHKEELIKKVGDNFKGVPVTDINGVIIHGFDRPKIIQALEDQGIAKV